MMNQKERNIMIVLLVILIVNVIILSTMLIILAVRTEKVEIQQQQEKVMENISEGEVDSTASIVPTEMESTNVFTQSVTEPDNANFPAANGDDFPVLPMKGFRPGNIAESETEIQSMSTEELVLYLKTVEGAVQELIEVMGKDWMVELTEKDFKTFCILVFAESGIECLEGQISVAATVINRMLNENFSNTFYGVMNQPYQFEVVKNGYIMADITNFEELPDATIEAVLRALQGEDPTEELLWEKAVELGVDPVKYAEGGALYFYNPRYCYRNPKVEISIGNHNFHKVYEG